MARQDFVGLRFAFHPGTLEPSARPLFALYIDALGLDLARTSHPYQLDFGHQQWQVVEIPFEAFDQINYYYGIEPLAQVNVIDLSRIEGNLCTLSGGPLEKERVSPWNPSKAKKTTIVFAATDSF